MWLVEGRSRVGLGLLRRSAYGDMFQALKFLASTVALKGANKQNDVTPHKNSQRAVF